MVVDIVLDGSEVVTGLAVEVVGVVAVVTTGMLVVEVVVELVIVVVGVVVVGGMVEVDVLVVVVVVALGSGSTVTGSDDTGNQ